MSIRKKLKASDFEIRIVEPGDGFNNSHTQIAFYHEDGSLSNWRYGFFSSRGIE